MDKIGKALQLTEQLLETAIEQDKEHRKRALENHKGSQAIGESFMVFYLGQLKKLLEENEED